MRDHQECGEGILLPLAEHDTQTYSSVCPKAVVAGTRSSGEYGYTRDKQI